MSTLKNNFFILDRTTGDKEWMCNGWWKSLDYLVKFQMN